MFTKPIDNSIKGYFDSLYQEAESKAKQAYQSFEQTIVNLDHYQQFKSLIDEDDRNDSLIANDPHPYYVKNSGSKEWLLTQFANRSYLLNVDESEDLKYSVSIGIYGKLISEKIRELEKEVPEYSYQMFQNKVVCSYFLSFNGYYTTDKKTHEAIRDWQADHMQRIVAYDYLSIIAAIQNHCRSLEEPLNFVLSEKEKVEFLLDKATAEAKSIKIHLENLTFFPGVVIDQFKDDLLVENLQLYRDQKLNLKVFTPATVKDQLELIRKKHKGILSDEVTIFYTIDKIANWLDLVIEGQPLLQAVKEPKWNELISATKYKAAKEVKKRTKEIEATAYDPNLPKAQIKNFLIEQFDNYRQKFNAFDHKEVFHALDKGADKLLKRSVTVNAFFSNDTELHLKILSDAIIIQDMLWVIVRIYADVFDTHRIEFPDDDRSHFAVHSLLNSMVLDKELYNLFDQSFNDFMVQHENYFIPWDVLFQNQKENMHHIFHRSIRRLQDVLNNAEPSNKVLYLQSRLKELRQRELQMKEFAEDREIGTYDDRYSVYFKDFLNIEAEFITETKNLSTSIPLTLNRPKPIMLLSNDTFENLLTEDNQQFILGLLEGLSLTNNGVSAISVRKKGALRGVVEALCESNILPAKSLEILCKLIAEKIGLELKSKLDHSDISEDFKSKARKYIKERYTLN